MKKYDTQYDVKFRQGKISVEFATENNVKEFSQIDNSKWNEFINRKITGVKSIWSNWNYLGNSEKKYYPQTIKLEFDNGRNIWISAIEIRGNQINGMADHLTIIFDSEIIEKYEIEIQI